MPSATFHSSVNVYSYTHSSVACKLLIQLEIKSGTNENVVQILYVVSSSKGDAYTQKFVNDKTGESGLSSVSTIFAIDVKENEKLEFKVQSYYNRYSGSITGTIKQFTDTL